MSGALTLATFLALAPTCAPTVDVRTLAAVVATESSFHPFAVAVNENGRTASSHRFATSAEATIYAEGLIARGVTNFDAGAAQINWRAGHLQRRGLPLAAAFDPCTAARVGSEVLAECWDRAPVALGEQARLDAALSCYNTGGFTAGLANGYVARVRMNFERRVVPALRARNGAEVPAPAPVIPSPAPVPVGPSPAVIARCGPVPASWDGWALGTHEACARRVQAAPPSSPDGSGGLSAVASNSPPEPR